MEKLERFILVNSEIKPIINQEAMAIKRPTIAMVIVELAEAVFLGSPPEVRYLKPPIISMIKREIPPRVRAIPRICSKIDSKSENVAAVSAAIVNCRRLGL